MPDRPLTNEAEVPPPQRIWIHADDTDCWCGYHFEDDDKNLTTYVPATIADTYRNERNEILTDIVARSGKLTNLDFSGDVVKQAKQALEGLVPASALVGVWEKATESVTMLCGMCAETARAPSAMNITAIARLDGHWVHLWKNNGTYAQRCDADRQITALEAARDAALSAGKDGDES